VRLIDERTLALPVYDGNGMFRTLGNLLVNPHIGLLFIDFETGARLRVNGTATIDLDGPLVASYPGAQGVVRVRATAIFANCRRYVHQYRKVTASPFVPRADVEAPVPDWKLDPWFDGTLAADDPAHDPHRVSAPAIPKF
jgi:predicted pyridoxine 5'-phosphate oxidase superfamily flavin-nucleotide-binding protein